MQLVVLLSCLMAAQAACPGPVIAGVHYVDKVLKAGLNNPKHLNYDSRTDKLYFNLYYSSTYERVIATLDLDSKEFSSIDPGGHPANSAHAISVDRQTGDIFVGHKVVYKVGKNPHKSSNFYTTDGVHWMFAKNFVYFTTYGPAYKYDPGNGDISVVGDLQDTKAHKLVIDHDDYLVFSNDTGLFGLKMDFGDTAVLYDGSSGKDLWALNINTFGEVYAAYADGVYAVNKAKNQIEKVLAVDHCYGVAFDNKNNIIYSDLTSIHRLEPSFDQDCVFEY